MEKSDRPEQRVDEPEIWRVFQRRGTPQILLLLSAESTLRASEIHRQIPTIARQVLGSRLNELVGLGLATREVDAGPPIASKYSLTSDGLWLAKAATILDDVANASIPDQASGSPPFRTTLC